MSAGERSPIASGVLLAVASAVGFGLTTPWIAQFGTRVGPLTTAALLYAGAAVLSIVARPFTTRSGRTLRRAAVPRLLTIALFGAVLAPALLVWGLSRAGPTASSLMLNFEPVFTALLAWAVYREHIGARVGGALVAMLLGGALVALDAGRKLNGTQLAGLVAVLLATASWALDNTVTRALAEEDPFDVVTAKGGLGALVTGTLAWLLHEPEPGWLAAISLLLCGATGYGLSLRLYLLAQRRIGAVRTSSVFAIGPFIGAAVAWLLGDRQMGAATGLGAIAFGLGVFLHLTESHSHFHVHEAIEHEHAHRHDDGHHDHVHVPPVAGEHTHAHRHERTTHAHPHAPDIHHGHRH